MLISVMDLFPVYDLFPDITGKNQFFSDFPTALSKTDFSRERANSGTRRLEYFRFRRLIAR